MSVGRVMGIEKNHQAVALAEQGDEVAVKIDHSRQPQLAYGRQFDYKDQLVSKVGRGLSCFQRLRLTLLRSSLAGPLICSRPTLRMTSAWTNGGLL